MRTFMRICVKFMAVASLAFVPIALYRLVVELAAGNVLGAIASLAFAPIGALLAYVFWTQADGIVEDYMARAPRAGGQPTAIEPSGWEPDESRRMIEERSGSASIERGPATRPAVAAGSGTATGGSGVAGVDPAALHAHLRAADAAMLDLARQHPDRPDLRWAAISAWAAEETAWVAGIPDGDHRLRLFTSEYAAATSAAQAFAADMGDAIGRGDTAAVERLSAAGPDLDRRFRLLFDLANAIDWS